jgi:hypothetical protein
MASKFSYSYFLVFRYGDKHFRMIVLIKYILVYKINLMVQALKQVQNILFSLNHLPKMCPLSIVSLNVCVCVFHSLSVLWEHSDSTYCFMFVLILFFFFLAVV